jgi:hypothetical protein
MSGTSDTNDYQGKYLPVYLFFCEKSCLFAPLFWAGLLFLVETGRGGLL